MHKGCAYKARSIKSIRTPLHKLQLMLRRVQRILSRSLATSQSHAPVRLNEIDGKWARIWKETFANGSLHPTQESREATKPFYCLTMFPYPSGLLHLGHQRVFTISDVISRYKRSQGLKVVHPMGWDAFGLPAENAAVEREINPAVWTEQNVGKMKEQMELMLLDFDWDREVNTSHPEYYKWTQKIFTLLFEKGLAYRTGAEINWDPVDQTVLANEQVDSNGRSWRSGALVEKKTLEQWFIGITKYADALQSDLKILDQWPGKVKAMQNHWIGRSEGAEIEFLTNIGSSVTVYTSRPETLFSVQFLAIAPLHPLAVSMSKKDSNLAAFIDECSQNDLPEDSKVGYKLKGVNASIPINPDGKCNENFEIPVYVAPFVLGSYGHGAVMGCPAHDLRDSEFWALHNPGIAPRHTVGDKDPVVASQNREVYTEKDGKLYDNLVLPDGHSSLDRLHGMECCEAKREIVSSLEVKGKGKKSVQFRIRDWLISRQRYWGAPIPIIHCKRCGPVAVPDKDLPVLLPQIEGESFGKGNPLNTIESFVNTKCPSCGGDAKRDTDTMDTFIDSSWYFFRYTDSLNPNIIFDHKKALELLPVDLYIGGVEHAILHLLYLRFVSKFLGDCNLWDGSGTHNEPIKQLITQGMVHGKTFTEPGSGRFLKPADIDSSDPKLPVIKLSGKKPNVTYEKMSKSKYNGVDPTEMIKTYGSDAMRAQILFAAPVSDVLNWNEDQIQGIERWLKRVLKMNYDVLLIANARKSTSRRPHTFEGLILDGKYHDRVSFNDEELALYNEVQTYTNKIARSIDADLSMNTIVSDFMKLTNFLQNVIKQKQDISSALIIDSYKKLLIIMAPVTPAVAEECWFTLCKGLGQEWRSILYQKYPNDKPIASSVQKVNVILNGKKIDSIEATMETLQLPSSQLIEHIKNCSKLGEKLGTSHIQKTIIKKNIVSIISK